MYDPKRLELLAKANLFNLAGNPYPGRAIIVGLDDTGQYLIQVYWIMGRSDNSRNRIFAFEGGRLFTEAADPSKVKDPSLIIYNAMREVEDGGCAIGVVSNGHQTDGVANSYKNGRSLHAELEQWEYEPDAPNFTPRITAVSCWLGGQECVAMSLLRKSLWAEKCDRHLYEFDRLGRGFGHCLTTYAGDGAPLPSFQGEPFLLPLCGDADFIATTFWEALDPDNRVSLAVKFMPKSGPSRITVINKYSKVA